MIMNNIAILSAGRRVDLVRAFQTELKSLIPTAKVFATDAAPELSSACQVADQAFKSPRVSDPAYIDDLLRICLENRIGLVIPTIDTELITLAQERERFQQQGIEIVISDLGLVQSCRDKRLTENLFQTVGINCPREYPRNELQFPCFAKPFDGSCSINVYAFEGPENLSDSVRNNEKLMFFELIDASFDEYTIDAYYDREGQLKCLVPRKRIEVRGGEVSKGVTHKNFVYDYCLEHFSKLAGARGCLTIQVFANLATGKILGIEINPRFGGGYPLTYQAGGNFPRWIIQEYLLNQSVDFCDSWQANLLMLRYDSAVYCNDQP